MNATTYTISVNESDLIDALAKAIRLTDDTQHWIAVRVAADGAVYVSEEVSRCESEDEYFHRMPHTVTVWSANGHGQCDLEEGADLTEDARELVADCVAKLEEAGYEVELS